jgi:hypothetical protein
MDGTKQYLKPGSHYLRRAIDTIEVEVPKWSMLVFHQNLVHGGSAYEAINTRIHSFVSNTPDLIPDNSIQPFNEKESPTHIIKVKMSSIKYNDNLDCVKIFF